MHTTCASPNWVVCDWLPTAEVSGYTGGRGERSHRQRNMRQQQRPGTRRRQWGEESSSTLNLDLAGTKTLGRPPHTGRPRNSSPPPPPPVLWLRRPCWIHVSSKITRRPNYSSKVGVFLKDTKTVWANIFSNFLNILILNQLNNTAGYLTQQVCRDFYDNFEHY